MLMFCGCLLALLSVTVPAFAAVSGYDYIWMVPSILEAIKEFVNEHPIISLTVGLFLAIILLAVLFLRFFPQILVGIVVHPIMTLIMAVIGVIIFLCSLYFVIQVVGAYPIISTIVIVSVVIVIFKFFKRK